MLHRVDPRENLKALLEPRSVAVIGASDRPGPGRRVIENLQHVGFEGEIIPVNPKYGHVSGLRCFASLPQAAQAGKQIDLAAIVVGRDRVMEVLEEAAQIGVRGIWTLASGFAEAGEGGRLLQNQAAAICRAHGMALCGPNSVGYLNPSFGSAIYSAPISPSLRQGSIGVVSQSGAICLALANSGRGLGFRLLVSSGNEATIDSTDYMEFLLRDPQTDVILAFLEELRRPQRFLDVARLGQQLGKPIVVLKLGRSMLAQRTVESHTGALAGVDDVYDAAFRKYGVIRVEDLDEMLETAAVFDGLHGVLPQGNRVGMLAVSGGEIGLIGDLSRDLNFRFPEWSNDARVAFAGVLPDYADLANPLDAWGSGHLEQTYSVCMDAAAKDDVDLLIVSQDAPRGLAGDQANEASSVARAAAKTRRASALPVVAISHLSGGMDGTVQAAFADGGIPLLQGTRAGLRAIHHLIEFARNRRTEACPSRSRKCRRGAVCFPKNGGVLDHGSARRLLAEYGIRGPREASVASPQEAETVAELIGYPVVLKAMASMLPLEAGSALPSVLAADGSVLRTAYLDVLAGSRALDQEIGILVQEVTENAVGRVFLGITSDPAFGPMVALGLLGDEDGRIEETVLGMPPLSSGEVRGMLERIQAGIAFLGAPEMPPGDIEALEAAVLNMGNLATDWGDRLQSVRIRPLTVLSEGLGVVAEEIRVEAAIDLRIPWKTERSSSRSIEWDLRGIAMSGSRTSAATGRKVAS